MITDGKVIVGTQGSGQLLAFDKNTGAPIWATLLDTHFAAVVTQSATVQGTRIFVGVASIEEYFAGLIPGYECCSFRGSMLALDVDTGAILWQTYMVPVGFSGNGIWGSAPAIDVRRGQVYIATGNNYSVPVDVLECVAAAGDDPDAMAACIPSDNLFDSIVALDMQTGAIRWSTRTLPYDAWTADCIPFLGSGDNCPDPADPGYDFGQAPALFSDPPGGMSRPQDLDPLGYMYALDAMTGEILWSFASGGSCLSGAAISKGEVYWAVRLHQQRVRDDQQEALRVRNSIVFPGPIDGQSVIGLPGGVRKATHEHISRRYGISALISSDLRASSGPLRYLFE